MSPGCSPRRAAPPASPASCETPSCAAKLSLPLLRVLRLALLLRLSVLLPRCLSPDLPCFVSVRFLTAIYFAMLLASRDLLRRHCALPRTFARARIGVRALAANRQIAAVTNPAVRLNFNQAPDIHLLLFAQVAFDAPFRFDRRANRGQLFFGQVLDLLGGVHLGLLRQGARARLSDAINRGEPNPQPLVRRQIYACNTSHNFLPNPGAAGASRWCRSPALRRADALLCTSCRFSLPMLEPSFSFSHLLATALKKPLASDYAAPSTCTGKRSARASGRTAKAPPPRDHLTGCG